MSYVKKLIKNLYNLFYTKPPSREKLSKDIISHFNKYIPQLEKIKQDTINGINILSENISKNMNIDIIKRLEYLDILENLYMQIKILNIDNIKNGEILLEKIVEFEKIENEIKLLPQIYINFELIDFDYIIYTYIMFYTGLIYYYDATVVLRIPIGEIIYGLTFYDIFKYSLNIIYILMEYLNKKVLYKSILGKPDEFKKLKRFLNLFGYITNFSGYIYSDYFGYVGNATGRSIFSILFGYGYNNEYFSGWKYKESPYDVLNVKSDVTLKELEKAYRKMTLKFHPDRNKDPNASEIFYKIVEAYEYLKDRVKNDNGIFSDDLSFFSDIKSQMKKTFPFLKKSKKSRK